MDRLPLIISGFAMAADRFGGLTANIIRDRPELLSLELLEAKIHFIQALFLTCIGVVFFLLGRLLLILAICCDLRRCLVQIEVQNVHRGLRRTFSNLNLGLAVAKQILGFMHDRKGTREG